jgi:hypothetical protein
MTVENGFVRLEALTELGTANLALYGAIRRVQHSRHQIGQMMRSDWRLYGCRGPFMQVCTTHGFKWHTEYISATQDPDYVIAESWGQKNAY